MAEIGDVVYWLAFDGHAGVLVPLPALVVRKLRLDELELHVFYHRDKLGAAADGRVDAVHGMRRGGWVHRHELLGAPTADDVEDKTKPCGNCAGCRNDDACLENGS